MPKRRYKQIPIDQSLRARALEIVAFHQREFASPSPASASPTSHALAVAVWRGTAELIDAYDQGTLPVNVQKKLIALLKEIVMTNRGVNS
jgi:hypothetical protein